MYETLHQYYLQNMGVDTWLTRSKGSDNNTLEKMALTVASCSRCPLHQTRTQTVFARGNPRAKLMIIGEAPGFYEDKQGLPFVGKAGALLNQMLLSIGLNEQDIYIVNVLKCRPPANRDPNEEEILQCSQYLIQQIEAVSPQLIFAVGRFAGQFLLNESTSLGKMRNKIHYYQHIPCLVSYHPAYLLRNPADKKNAYSDLLHVKQFLLSQC